MNAFTLTDLLFMLAIWILLSDSSSIFYILLWNAKSLYEKYISPTTLLDAFLSGSSIEAVLERNRL